MSVNRAVPILWRRTAEGNAAARLLVAMLLLLPLSGLYAQPAAFTRMGFGAYGVGLGNALVADVWGEASPFYNPALAPSAARQNLEASVALLSMDRQLQHLQFATPLKPRAGLAFGLTHAGVSNIDGRDASGYHTGLLSIDEYSGFMAFGTQVSERMAIGLALQFFRAEMAEGLDPVTSLGLDVGFTFRPADSIAVGFVVEDLLARYEWDTTDLYGAAGRLTTDHFPVRIRGGISGPIPNISIRYFAEVERSIERVDYADFSTPTEPGEPVYPDVERRTLGQWDLRAGAEYRPLDIFRIRAGVNHLVRGALRPSVGFSVYQPVGNIAFRADYAVLPEPASAGLRHLVSVRMYM